MPPYLRLLLALAFGLLIGLLLGWRNGRVNRPGCSAEAPAEYQESVRPDSTAAYVKLVSWSPSFNANPTSPPESVDAEDITGREHYQTTLWGGFSVRPL